jgi:Tfp pilus assembly protein PilV
MRRRAERGETLAEVLVSTTLLGIIGVGIIGAIAAVLTSTDIDRKDSRAETVLRSYVAAVEDADYRPAGDYGDAGYTVPAPYTVSVTGVHCWVGVDPSTSTSSTQPISFGACQGDGNGLQRLDLEVTTTGTTRRVTERVTIFKRDERAS